MLEPPLRGSAPVATPELPLWLPVLMPAVWLPVLMPGRAQTEASNHARPSAIAAR